MTIQHPRARLLPPTPPSSPPRPPFPWIAALTPVLSSLVLYALTSSPYTLALAALGPVVALASFLDAARLRGRTARREAERYSRELAEHTAATAEARAEELAALRRASPLPLDVLEQRVPADARWRRPAEGLEVVLGRTRETGEGAQGDGEVLLAAMSSGIGVVGPAVLTRALVRGLLVQIAELVTPEALRIELPSGTGWRCLRALPHTRSAGAPLALAVLEGDAATEADAVLALAGTAAELPKRCRCIVQLGGAGVASVVGRRGPGTTEPLVVDFVAAEQARGYAESLAAARGAGPAELPETVLLSDLGGRDGPDDGTGLPVLLGRTPSGPIEIDLVRDGPHAVVGGTTGSGKSELLIAWVVGLAIRHPPTAVTFLLADFKGGAGFSALRPLPHVTGVITDLDTEGALRAFTSIAAELRRREVVLAERGVPDIARLAPGVLARLVVVVDECAVVLERAPELHRTFADIAARGRSLGVHLVLCTQRPVGVVRDAVAANCGLRIALRVHDAADSRALIGSDAAARIPHRAAGRCVVSVGGRGQLVQAALAQEDDIARARRSGAGSAPAHRPWLDPLPDRIPLPEHRRTGRIVLGVVDRPAEQRQDVVHLDHRSLLVLGAAGSGRSGALRTVAAQLGGARTVGPLDVEEAWDAVVAEEGPSGPLLLDDLDLLLRRCAEDERRRLLDALQTALRSGGEPIVATARRATDGLAGLRDAFDDVLLLRAAHRQEHQLLALHGEPYRGDLPPGGGWWRGERIQVFAPPPSPPSPSGRRPAAVPVVPRGEEPFVVLTNRAGALRARLTAVGVPALPVPAVADGLPPAGAAILGSVAEWSVARALLARLRASASVVLDLPPAEARVVLGPLPPAPLCAGDRVLLLVDDRLRRARWPDAPAS
ncbi:S-DNA-T family DNA segregation ATPase FtsK/SpoIIIE [Rathayibacter sp. PhB151]|uniref:FtsK/SpoIIIE domain-containing protein n=1 Tax=Rathayibacter sp. PhB151 TaxID=2485189 RepID=UPI0010623C67|nr:FtsK/SpoIIIE domain-containing protein [Rathayibacter sp. PhB151]TDX78370.1 S-DNA-T family DNA segregation ATPase FtsK/SpoIIIE [Rathayibacter sp. PhB151]